MATPYDSIDGRPDANAYVNSILWGGWRWSNDAPITYYFDDSGARPWNAAEKAAYREALKSWTDVANIRVAETGVRSQANFVESLVNTTPSSLGRHETAEQALQNGFAPGQYNVAGHGWDYGSTSGGLQKGGLGYLTLVHELGHALGLAHPHDTGGGSTLWPTVLPRPHFPMPDLPINTVMSYNSSVGPADATKPNARTSFGDTYGFTSGPSFVDIYAIQKLYGANMSHRTGNDTYYLPDTNGPGTFWHTIWDAGGTDTIAYNGSRGADIRLTNPNLESGARDVTSRVGNTYGGFVIAIGVVIENASGGSGGDRIHGNNYGNTIWGNGGQDQIWGGEGNDVINGGADRDYLYGDGGDDILYGGEGDDILRGGRGRDEIWSGAGNDVYEFTQTAEVGDVWRDWNAATDIVRIDKEQFGLDNRYTLASQVQFENGTNASPMIFTGGGGVQKQFYILWDKPTGQLAFDSNGVAPGGKTLLATVLVDPVSAPVDKSWSVAGSGDFDGDGDTDIAWRNTSGESLIWKMQNGVRQDGVQLGDVDNSWRLAAIGDYTGDGRDDVVWHNAQSGEVLVWKMVNGVKQNGFALGFIDTSWKVESAADFNGDGTDDLIFRNKTSNEALVWTMNNGVKTNGYGLGTIDNIWSFAAAGDFNNDGRDDIAFRNSLTGELLLWKMFNAQKVNGYLLGAVDLSWKLASAGDTNNDGTADIVWANSQSGEVLRWGVQNFNKVSGSLATIAGGGWTAVGDGDFNNNGVADLLWRNGNGNLVVSQYNAWNTADMTIADFMLI